MSALLQLAAAGGGSSGFGGGGGGGGGFSGGGGGGGVYIGGGSGGGILLLILVIAVVGFFLFTTVATWLMVRRMRARLDERDRRVRTAAAEAAEDDSAFAADRVTQDAAVMFHAIQGAWDARDERTLATMVGDDLLAEWRLRLADFARKGWHNRVRVISGPQVKYVGLVNREDDADDRVVLHVAAQLEDYVELPGGARMAHTGQSSTVTTLSEYWTLGKRDGRWILISIEQDREGLHNLDAPIVASPWGDEQRLRDAALVEGAVADANGGGSRFATAELVDVDLAADARAQALDLSLVDGRFAPDVLAAAARRAADGWAEAVDGADGPLEAVATPAAVDALLYGGDASHRTRLVVRGPRVEQVQIDALLPTPAPARMTLAVHVRGRRYVEDRDTAAVLSGSKDRETSFTERWTMALDGTDDTPWRLVGVA
ncbi:MAG TPA: TIM44-like domain-containing protein [Solirubrobacteraceae bacterium]|nr:TIM44-like domain-containing protein [Solirubrobacteraceae bacterium]